MNAASQVAVNTVDLRRFVQTLHDAAAYSFRDVPQPGRLQLSKLHPDLPGISIVGRYAIGEVDRMVRDAATEAGNGFNVFIEGRTVADHVRGPQRGDGANGTRGVFALVVDNDADKGKSTSVAGSPSLVVESSPGNSHVWYFLDRAVTYADAVVVGGKMRAAGGDSATGKPDQPYRVAGTINYPGENKRKRGRVVTSSSIIAMDGMVFSLDDLATLWPDAKAGGAKERTRFQAEGADADALIARCSRHRRQQLGEVDAADRSAHFFKVTGWLKGDGFTADEALELWRAFPEGAGVSKWGDGDKLGKEVLRAWDRVADEPRQPDEDVADDIITEDSVALHFADVFRDRLRFCHDTGKWFEWTGTVWRQNKTGLAFTWARSLVRELTIKEASKTRFLSSKASFAASVERYCKSDEVFAVTTEAWDRDPLLIGTPGGTVNLRDGVMRAADPAEGITKQTAVAPSSTAECPRWMTFLEQATGGDAALVRFLQQWAGYALTGDTREHALVFVYGPGGNGKSVFLNVVTGILDAYAATAAMDTFTASKGDKHPTDLAMLRGARLVTASETEEGKAWAESRIKQMTGGDPISARFMRQDFFTFKPDFKLTIIGNHKPVLKNVDEAARRRFNIVPFTLKPAKPDRELEAKLHEEWPGILRWMIDGCLDWQRNGLLRPASVAAATEEYFSDQDLFSQWLDDECDVEPDNTHKRETVATLYASWSAYAKAAGEESGTVKAFSPNMLRKGLRPYRTNATRGFSGVRLTPKPSYGGDR